MAIGRYLLSFLCCLFLTHVADVLSHTSDVNSAAQDNDFTYASGKISPWKSSHCDDPIMDYPKWKGFPVSLCEYTDSQLGATVKTYMLNADRPKLSRWIVTACRDSGAQDTHACIDDLVKQITDASSGGIFPIAGYIPEPQDGGICYVFRDGVTVWTNLRKFWLKPKHKACGNSDAEEMTQPVFKVWRYARIASTTRSDYQAAGGTQPVEGLKWMDAIPDEYQKAWNSDRNALISAKAKAEKRSGAFK